MGEKDMSDIFDFKTNLNTFYEKLNRNNNENQKHDRYLSWEHCYLYFLKNHDDIKNNPNNDKIIDDAALNLAFYLASWGMYRGSSFILQYDYKIHKEIIKKLISNEYCSLFYDYTDWNKINNAKNLINEHYKSYMQKYSHSKEISNTLVTKILMGIFACTPAYDRFFIGGLSEFKKINNANITKNFCKNNHEYFLKLIEKEYLNLDFNLISDSSIPYPKMKLIDMAFWNAGFYNNFKAIKKISNEHIKLLSKLPQKNSKKLENIDLIKLNEIKNNPCDQDFILKIQPNWEIETDEDHDTPNKNLLYYFIKKLQEQLSQV